MGHAGAQQLRSRGQVFLQHLLLVLTVILVLMAALRETGPGRKKLKKFLTGTIDRVTSNEYPGGGGTMGRSAGNRDSANRDWGAWRDVPRHGSSGGGWGYWHGGSAD